MKNVRWANAERTVVNFEDESGRRHSRSIEDEEVGAWLAAGNEPDPSADGVEVVRR